MPVVDHRLVGAKMNSVPKPTIRQNNGKPPIRFNVAKLRSLEIQESLEQRLSEVKYTFPWDYLKKNIYETADAVLSKMPSKHLD